MPASLIEAADRVTPGHDEAKRLLAAALVQHAIRTGENDRQAGLAPLFVAGGHGAGQVPLVKAMVAEAGLAMTVLDVPLLFAEALVKAQPDFAAFSGSPGVIVVNHIEAAAMRGDRAEECRRMQQSLIALIDGATLPTSNEPRYYRTSFDTARALFIALGEFPELQHAGADTLAAQGFLPELVARFGTFITLPPLTEEEMISLLTREGGFLTACAARFARYGMRVTIDESAVKEVAQLGVRRKAGIRGLEALVDRLGIALAVEQVPAGQEIRVDSGYVRRQLE